MCFFDFDGDGIMSEDEEFMGFLMLDELLRDEDDEDDEDDW